MAIHWLISVIEVKIPTLSLHTAQRQGWGTLRFRLSAYTHVPVSRLLCDDPAGHAIA